MIFGRRRVVWSDQPDAAHILRQVCRARVLEGIPVSRFDSEGSDLIALEVVAQPRWKHFLKNLIEEGARLLDIFGAERRHLRPEDTGAETRTDARYVITAGSRCAQA